MVEVTYALACFRRFHIFIFAHLNILSPCFAGTVTQSMGFCVHSGFSLHHNQPPSINKHINVSTQPMCFLNRFWFVIKRQQKFSTLSKCSWKDLGVRFMMHSHARLFPCWGGDLMTSPSIHGKRDSSQLLVKA